MNLEHKLKKLEAAAELLDTCAGKCFEAGTIADEVIPEFSINRYTSLRLILHNEVSRLKDACHDLRMKGEPKT